MYTKPLVFNEQTITVRELTLGEVRNWYQALAAGELFGDWVQETALEDIGLVDLAYMTDAAPDDLERLNHRQLVEIVAAARSLNPAMFRLRDHIRTCAKEIANLVEGGA